jgi:hypothetical protein
MSTVAKRRWTHEEENNARNATTKMEKSIVRSKSGENAQNEEGRKRGHT